MYQQFLNKMPKYTLQYFDGRGRAEVSRLIFAAAGVAFEDQRIDGEDWPKIKSTTPFGSLPVLVVDGQQFAQSMSIARYLADTFGLAGKSGTDKLCVDEAAELVQELFEAHIKVMFTEESKKAEALAQFKKDTLPKMVENIEKVFARNKSTSGFIVGDKLSYADLYLLSVLDQLPEDAVAAMSKTIQKNRATVQALPNVKAYLKKRPTTSF
ncbi:glutathione S-transferase-like [Lineus longissimus]|uniref:glutathione S-transferase-like n=1 Tax=Lineus longissimus TaxID=88925 RepID=UPI00315C81E7